MYGSSLPPWPHGKLPAAEFCGDCERLGVLAGFGIDHLENDPELQGIVGFAAQLCEVPIVLVSIVEERRQRFIAREGLDAVETPREQSFCAHAMIGNSVMIIRDAALDPTFRDNPLVTGEPHIRFYAGMPLVTSEGAPLGSLCVIDTKPRPSGLNDHQIAGLRVLSQAVMRRLESQRQAARSGHEGEALAKRLRSLLDSVPDIAWSAEPGPRFDHFNARWVEVTGTAAPEDVADWASVIHPDDWAATQEKFADAVARAAPFEDEWRLRQADGTYRWVLSRAVPSHDDPENAHWFGTLTDIDEAHRLAEQRDLLAHELAHRIKNIFSVVNGLISLRSRSKPEVQDFAAELSETFRALGRAQDFVRPLTDTKGDSLRGLLDVLTAPYNSVDGQQVQVSGDTVEIGIRAATPMALIFHELATNSAKYGALSAVHGRVEVQLDRQGENVRIVWRETGGPQVTAPGRTGFGSRLLQMSVESQLNGKLEREWAAGGLQVKLTIPKASLVN